MANMIKKLTNQILIKTRLFLGLLLGMFFPMSVSAQTTSPLFGTIEPPVGVEKYQSQIGPGEIGIILFVSNVIRLITIVAGIWTMLNFILAGWLYITSSGDADTGSKVSTKMINSVMGFAIVALSYTIAAIVGLLVFGDASYIINPQLTSVLN